MSLRFVIEASPVPQAETEREFNGGQLSIGRSADADWQIDDPNAFISRRHVVISEEDGQVIATDASSGGLFVDNGANAVGLGNSVPLTPGMRLHLGDFTLRVEAASGATSAPAPPKVAPRGRSFFPDDDEEAAPPPPPPARPEGLPDPFGLRSDSTEKPRHTEVARTPRPLDQADPFGLDLRSSAVEPSDTPSEKRSKGSYFESTPEEAPRAAEPVPEPPEAKPDIFGIWNNEPAAGPPETPQPAPQELPAPPEAEAARAPEPIPAPPKPAASRNDEDLRDALLRGMGLDPAQMATDDPVAEMEHLGRSMRSLVEGVMLLLRTRAQEKQKVRVAQTIIASADVNPLKFLATPEDALSALIRPRGKGYLAPEAAIDGAFRDLADHQVRTWSALQVALRRMIDKFDPSEIAKEMDDVGLLESLVAGGRSAKLWQIYEDRYRDIAQTAEKQFLGDVGVDFRDAYENRRTD